MSATATIIAITLQLAAASGETNLEARVRAHMATELKDASSAQFLDLKEIPQRDGSSHICGKVNAKNAFGAYVGFREFVAAGGVVVIADPNNPPALLEAELDMIRHFCRG